MTMYLEIRRVSKDTKLERTEAVLGSRDPDGIESSEVLYDPEAITMTDVFGGEANDYEFGNMLSDPRGVETGYAYFQNESTYDVPTSVESVVDADGVETSHTEETTTHTGTYLKCFVCLTNDSWIDAKKFDATQDPKSTFSDWKTAEFIIPLSGWEIYFKSIFMTPVLSFWKLSKNKYAFAIGTATGTLDPTTPGFFGMSATAFVFTVDRRHSLGGTVELKYSSPAGYGATIVSGRIGAEHPELLFTKEWSWDEQYNTPNPPFPVPHVKNLLTGEKFRLNWQAEKDSAGEYGPQVDSDLNVLGNIGV